MTHMPCKIMQIERSLKNCCKEHAACKMRSSSSNMLQIPCKMTGFSDHVKGEKSKTCSCCVPHESFQASHTQIRCFQHPRTRVKTPCRVDTRHFLQTSGTVSCKMLQIRYFSLNMLQANPYKIQILVQKCCNYDAVKRFKVQNAANTVQIGDSGSTMLPIPRK